MGSGSGEREARLFEDIVKKLLVIFPDGTPDAGKKRAETLEYIAEQELGQTGTCDLITLAELPLADLEKLWRAVDGIVDAH